MNDLDDLIRATLQEHTPVPAADDTLASRITAAGRRVRRARAAGVGALVLLTVAGVGWASTSFPRTSQPVIAASPSVPQPTADPTNGPTTPGASATVRDVSTIGEEGETENYVFLNNSFASPGGSLHCFINSSGAGCSGTWDRGVAPSQKKACPNTEPLLGPELWGSGEAAWTCGSDPHSLPYLGGEGGDSVAWWDATFGESAPSEPDPSRKLAVLPYGKTLVAGDFRCTAARDGVTCTNTRSGHGFQASRDKVDLNP